ncbi:hypothetical protein C8F01DRAFT_1348994 [Mycena amicta]|nr:hypothetical protein C8F01DRAFT_1348994 [Mycena amicta]
MTSSAQLSRAGPERERSDRIPLVPIESSVGFRAKALGEIVKRKARQELNTPLMVPKIGTEAVMRGSKDTDQFPVIFRDDEYGVGKNRVIQGYRAIRRLIKAQAACPEEWLENLATKKDAKEKKVKTKEGDARQAKERTGGTAKALKSEKVSNSRDEEAAAMDNTGAPSDKEDEVKDDEPEKPEGNRRSTRKASAAARRVDDEGSSGREPVLKRGRQTAVAKDAEDPGTKQPGDKGASLLGGSGTTGEQGNNSKKHPVRKIGPNSRADRIGKSRTARPDTRAPDTPAIGRESRPPGKKNRAKRRAGQKAEEEETAPDPESEEDSGRAATTISRADRAAETDKQPGSSVERDVTTDIEMHADEEEEHGPCEKCAGARNTDAKRREDEAELPEVRLRTTKASRSASNGNQPSTATREDARQPFFTFPHPADRDPSPPTSEANRKLTASKTTQGKNVARKNKGRPTRKSSSRKIGPASRIARGSAERDGEDAGMDPDRELKVEHPLAGRGGGGAGSGQGEIGDKDMSEAKLKEIYAWQEGVKRNLKHRASGDLESVSSKTKRRKEDAGTYSISEKRYGKCGSVPQRNPYRIPEELDENEDATKLAQWRYDIQVAIFPHDNRRPSYSVGVFTLRCRT